MSAHIGFAIVFAIAALAGILLASVSVSRMKRGSRIRIERGDTAASNVRQLYRIHVARSDSETIVPSSFGPQS